MSKLKIVRTIQGNKQLNETSLFTEVKNITKKIK